MPNFDPLYGYGENEMREYFDQACLKEGDKLIVYNGQYGVHEYNMVAVELPDHGKQHRIVVGKEFPWASKSWYRSGKNCQYPKGKSRLLPPVKDLVDRMGSDTRVEIKFSGN